MEQVLYVLGAGFSAPLGVPVMSTFLDSARAVRREEGDKCSYFDEVFAEIQRIAAVKNWVNSNQHNLEEVLSILEMEDILEGRLPREGIGRMICEVIKRRTPAFDITQEELKAGDWIEFAMGRNRLRSGYVGFVAHLLGVELHAAKKVGIAADGNVVRSLDFKPIERPDTRYAVITFNYDMVLERCVQYLNQTFKGTLAFLERPTSYLGPWGHGCPLIKLHGSVEGLGLTLPTWTKGAARGESIWKDAAHLLSTATQIRFVGFSFSASDSHFEFLVKASLAQHGQLNRVDVACLDPRGIVRSRYESMFAGPREMRFANADFGDFAVELADEYRSRARSADLMRMTLLEGLHGRLMERHGAKETASP